MIVTGTLMPVVKVMALTGMVAMQVEATVVWLSW